jgi:hypothetical protein
VTLAALQMRLYASVGHDTAMAKRLTSEATSGVSGTKAMRALPPAVNAGPVDSGGDSKAALLGLMSWSGPLALLG